MIPATAVKCLTRRRRFPGGPRGAAGFGDSTGRGGHPSVDDPSRNAEAQEGQDGEAPPGQFIEPIYSRNDDGVERQRDHDLPSEGHQLVDTEPRECTAHPEDNQYHRVGLEQEPHHVRQSGATPAAKEQQRGQSGDCEGVDCTRPGKRPTSGRHCIPRKGRLLPRSRRDRCRRECARPRPNPR